MVKICNSQYPDDSKYTSYFESFTFPLSDFQKYAIEAIVSGNHILVTAHTGSGKTLPAEFALQHFVEQGKKLFIPVPLRLSQIRNSMNLPINILIFRLDS